MNVIFSFEAKDKHLQQILDLQRINLKSHLLPSVCDEAGFVTMQYSFDQLKKMHQETPHLVILLDDQVIGYALAMPGQFGKLFPGLDPMFQITHDQLLNIPSSVSKDFLVMGQVCIAKEFRGTGLFQRLYDVYLNKYIPQFGLVVTEIAAINKRSMSAHKKVGFQELTSYIGPDDNKWVIVYCKNQ